MTDTGKFNKVEKNLLWGSNFLAFGQGMLGPLLAVFATRIGGDILDVSWAWAIYLIVTGSLMVVIGKWADRSLMSQRRLMVYGYGLSAIFSFCYLLVSSPAQLFLVQAGQGMALALLEPTWASLYARYENKDHGGLTWGLAYGEWYFITGIAILVGGFIVSAYSFEVLFITMGTLSAFATAYQARILSLRK